MNTPAEARRVPLAPPSADVLAGREASCGPAHRRQRAGPRGMRLGAIAVRAPQGAQEKSVAGLDVSGFIEGVWEGVCAPYLGELVTGFMGSKEASPPSIAVEYPALANPGRGREALAFDDQGIRLLATGLRLTYPSPAAPESADPL